MNPDPVRSAPRTLRIIRLLAVVSIVFALLLTTSGCDELKARRKVQAAGKLYERGEFDQAAKLYDEVLNIVDSGYVAEVAHYNAGITYNKLFRPGVETPDNIEIANRTAMHFGKYLQSHPGDTEVVGLMTQLWLDAGQYDKALQYWESEHDKNPRDTEVIGILAGIHRQAGNWEKAVDWYYKEADVLTTPQAKASAYLNVGRLAANKLLNRAQSVWFERLKVADVGIGAMQKALALDEKNPELHLTIGGLYSLRSEAHQAAWAQVIDKSNGRVHFSRSAALRRELEGEQAGDKKPVEKDEGKATSPTEGSDDKGAGESDTGAQPQGKNAAEGEQPQGKNAAEPDKSAAAATPPATGTSPEGGQ